MVKMAGLRFQLAELPIAGGSRWGTAVVVAYGGGGGSAGGVGKVPHLISLLQFLRLQSLVKVYLLPSLLSR